MTYITINTSEKEALQFLKYAKTLPFVTIHKGPNPSTLKAMEDVKKGKTKKHKSSKALISMLNK